MAALHRPFRRVQRTWLRGVVGLTAAAVLLGMSTGAVSASSDGASVQTADRSIAAVPAAASTDEDGDLRAALGEAEDTGEPVDVPTLTDEFTKTTANPDGSTYTMDMTAVPMRVQADDGSWVPIDPTLELRADGRIWATASPIDVSFSDGGDGHAAVSLNRKGSTLVLGWPQPLSKPTVSGATATYADVLPDVDLLLTATQDGFQQVLRVRTAEAAANPGLTELRLDIETSNLTMVPDASGGLVGFDDAGHRMVSSPSAIMWDSSATTDPAPAAAPGFESPKEPEFAGPSAHDEVAQMEVAVDDDAITVTPDQEFLDDEDTVYPVYVDPWIEMTMSGRIMVGSNGEHEWSFTGDEGVGRCASICGGPYTKRMFFEFTNTKLQGKRVLAAKFLAYETHSYSCTATAVRISRTDVNISSATRWPGPAGVDALVDRKASAGRGAGCSPAQPASWIEFEDAAAGDNLNGTVAQFAGGEFGSTMTLMLRATDESDANGWKRFRNDATLSVKIMYIPAAPTSSGVRTSSDPGTQQCSTSPSAPTLVANPRPVMEATVQTQVATPDDAEASLRGVYHVQYQSDAGVWTDKWAGSIQPDVWVDDGAETTLTPPSNLDDGLWRFQVHTLSRGYRPNGEALDLTSATSPAGGWCYFNLDSTGPLKPEITSPNLPECLPNNCPTSELREGEYGQLKFTVADPSVMGFKYQVGAVTGSTTDVSVVNGVVTATVSVRLPASGGVTAQAWSLERQTGKISTGDTYLFKVALPPPDLAAWRVSETPEANPRTVADSSGRSPHRDLLLNTGASVSSKGRRETLRDANGVAVADSSISFNGSAGAVATASDLVVDTTAPFAVSAWANLSAPAKNATILGQADDDSTPDGFALRWNAAAKRWEFVWHAASGAQVVAAGSVDGQPGGVWTHLLGTYDPVSDKLTLYVNGIEQGSATVATVRASGPFTLGSTHYTAGPDTAEPLTGLLDEVRVMGYVPAPTEIARLATEQQENDNKQGLALVGSWEPSMAAPGATSVPDVSPYDRGPLVLSGGATVADDHTMKFDGEDDFASVPGPVVDDNGSFTVATKVRIPKPENLAAGTSFRVLGQSASNGSSWALTYTQRSADAGVWAFTRTGTGGQTTVADDWQPAGYDGEVVLTGVYDAQTRMARLYVLTAEQASQPSEFAARGVGDIVAAKPQASGAWSSYKGFLGPVRIWAGAMDPDQIQTEVVDQ